MPGLHRTSQKNYACGKKRKGHGGSRNRKSRSGTRKAVEQIGTATFDKTPRKLEITVPVPTPSSNQWVWKHWSAYRDIKKDWLKRLHAASVHHCGLGLFGKSIENASLTIERFGLRELDEDNLKGGVKPVIDSLIQLGFLANDTPDVIQHMDVYQTIVDTRAAQGTRITLIEQAGSMKPMRANSLTMRS